MLKFSIFEIEELGFPVRSVIPTAKIAQDEGRRDPILAYKPEARGGSRTVRRGGGGRAGWAPRATMGDCTGSGRFRKTLAAAQENLASVDAAPTAVQPSAECVTRQRLVHWFGRVLKALDNGGRETKTRIAESPCRAKGFASAGRGDEAARRAVTNPTGCPAVIGGGQSSLQAARLEIVERSFAHNLTRSPSGTCAGYT